MRNASCFAKTNRYKKQQQKDSAKGIILINLSGVEKTSQQVAHYNLNLAIIYTGLSQIIKYIKSISICYFHKLTN